MAFSEEWYETELKSSELETLHRPPTVEYSFYTAVKTGDMETVIQNCNADSLHLSIWREPVCSRAIHLPT